MKILCIYALHEINLNVEFFIKHGMIQDPNVDYYFVINNLDLELNIPNATVINRENSNYDFGAWSQVLLKDKLYQEYDYFVMINSSVRGPFYPVWAKHQNWIHDFINELTDFVKLVGTTIATVNSQPHVQSMLLVTDKIGMQIGIDAGIFSTDDPSMDMPTIIQKKEIGYSTAILDQKYNIGCMLKAYQGVDFRITKDLVDIPQFDGGYYGMNVHPYEVIFAKISTKNLGIEKSIQAADKYTNWTDTSADYHYDRFNWVHYLLANSDLYKADIDSKHKAEHHYQSVGWKEFRKTSPFMDNKYYLIDLNPYCCRGLVNQLYALINAIMIGHFTNRFILVCGFYPQYNKFAQIPLNKVVDISKLNLKISKLSLQTYLVDMHKLSSTVKTIIGDRIHNSKYMNPLTIKQSFVDTMTCLNSETYSILNLGETFSATTFLQNADITIQKQYRKLLNAIEFTPTLNKLAAQIKNKYELDTYKAVHLRLEDDVLDNDVCPINVLIEQYQKKLSKMATTNDTIYVATHLCKSDNLLNPIIDQLREKYPKLIVADVPNTEFEKGREIDAILDLIICRDADMFLGWHYSTFSNMLMIFGAENGKFYYDAGIPALDNPRPENMPAEFQILSGKVQHGRLGINGELGYTEADGICELEIITPHINMISAHAPSKVVIDLKVDAALLGYCSPTAQDPPLMQFICDNMIIGELSEADQNTPPYEITAGKHTLEIVTNSVYWAHSIWLLEFEFMD